MNNRIFYLKKTAQIGKISIWLVDGKEIRSHIDEEFNNFGQHFRFPYIPKYEFWLDREATPDERRFFIDHLLVEWKMQNEGYAYEIALNVGDLKERIERQKAGDTEKILAKDGGILFESIQEKLLKKVSDISIWLVAGRLVRSNFDIDFTEGGHDLVYSFVPSQNVWIDDDLVSAERPFVILHELFERSLMLDGLSYNQAHKRASRLEWSCRHDEKKLEENLKRLNINNYSYA